MRTKIFIGLTSCVLMLALFFAFIGEASAQPRNQGKKPNDRAKKLAAQGDVLYNQKDYRGAINKYAEAIAISPNFPQAHFFKGSAHLFLDENDAAIEEFDAALLQGFAPMKVHELRWEAHFEKQNYDAALNDVRQGLRIEPNNSYLTLALGSIYLMKESYQDAIDTYNKVLSTNPNLPDVHYFVAFSYSRLGNFEQQELAAIEAIKKNTQYAGESYKLIGDALAVGRKPKEAILAYERALNVKPEMQEVYSNLASIYQNQSRLTEAINTAKKGIKLFPDDENLWVALTWFYSLADRNTEAVGAGQQAVRVAPNQYMAHTNLCRAYNDTKQYPQAILSCNKALALQPNDGETSLYIARAYDLTNKPDLATQFYKKAVSGLIEYVRVNSESADAYYLLANAYFADQQRGKAIENFKKSLQFSPNFAKARYNLGYLYFLENNMSAAREQQSLLVKLDPVLGEKLKQAMEKK